VRNFGMTTTAAATTTNYPFHIFDDFDKKKLGAL
jgi:hypothetical protein